MGKAGDPGGVCDDRLPAAGAGREDVKACAFRRDQAAEGEAADAAGDENVCVDGLGEAGRGDLFEPELISGTVIALRIPDDETDGAGGRAGRVQRQRGGQRLRAFCCELCGDRDPGVSLLRDQIPWLDLQRKGQAFDPGDGELTRAGFQPADRDGRGGGLAAAGNIRQGVTPCFANLAQATHHPFYSGYAVSYRDTIMAKVPFLSSLTPGECL